MSELTWARFDALVTSLARRIRRTFRPEAVVGVAHGGVFVGGAVASALEADFYPVRITRRSRDQGTLRRPKLSGKLPEELKRKRVLVVDDVASSGDTLELAKKLLKQVGAKESRTATLVRKARGYAPDWSAMTTAELVVFPWDYSPVAQDIQFR